MSKQYNLIILPEAQKDIRDIVIYIARELAAPQAALNLQAEFEKAINTLAERPKRIKTVNEQPWKDVGIRKIRLTPGMPNSINEPIQFRIEGRFLPFFDMIHAPLIYRGPRRPWPCLYQRYIYYNRL